MSNQYILPPLDILPDSPAQQPPTALTGAELASFISQHGAPCYCVYTTTGAAVTTHHFKLNPISNLSKLKRIFDMVQAEYGKSTTRADSEFGHFAITVPNSTRQTVYLKDTLAKSYSYEKLSPYKLIAGIGTDTAGESETFALEDMPHLLVSGSTGGGKSVLLHDIITSLLLSKTPERLQLLMIDTKHTEFRPYENLPHLLQPVITSPLIAVEALEQLCKEMDERYWMMGLMKTKSCSWKPKIAVFIDEFADLVMSEKLVNCPSGGVNANGTPKKVKVGGLLRNYIIRLAQKARGSGIHLVIATQSPNADVICKSIRANFPARIALKTSTRADSQISSDGKCDCVALLGRGDAYLISPDTSQPIRFQAAHCQQSEIDSVVEWWKSDKCKA
jgi:S-DNA-T family DNA segregation ATPase FtsK/SpoIIIE